MAVQQIGNDGFQVGGLDVSLPVDPAIATEVIDNEVDILIVALRHILAARAAIYTWKGKEGALSQEIERSNRLSMDTLQRWLGQWMPARSVPNRNRDRLLAFINGEAIPAFRKIKRDSGDAAYELVEELSQSALESKVLSGRPTSLISKLALAMSPEIFVPYDTRVRKALKLSGQKIPEHGYAKYMEGVLAEKPAFLRTLNEKGLTAGGLGAVEMSQSLFEMRALDKRLMRSQTRHSRKHRRERCTLSHR